MLVGRRVKGLVGEQKEHSGVVPGDGKKKETVVVIF